MPKGACAFYSLCSCIYIPNAPNAPPTVRVVRALAWSRPRPPPIHTRTFTSGKPTIKRQQCTLGPSIGDVASGRRLGTQGLGSSQATVSTYTADLLSVHAAAGPVCGLPSKTRDDGSDRSPPGPCDSSFGEFSCLVCGSALSRERSLRVQRALGGFVGPPGGWRSEGVDYLRKGGEGSTTAEVGGCTVGQ